MALIDPQNLPPPENKLPFPYDWAVTVAREGLATGDKELKLPFPYDWAVTVALQEKYAQSPVKPAKPPSPPPSRESARPGKSARLGLSFAYDWSNPEIDDDVLIWHVLDRGIFLDILRICKHFGLERVERIASGQMEDPIHKDSLTRMLRNIRIGYQSRHPNAES